MDDIPIGTPPAPPGRHAAPGGWYPDPSRPGQERYWDGWQWSRNTRPSETVRTGNWGVGSPVPGHSAPYGAGSDVRVGVRSNQQSVTADGVRLASWWWRVLSVVVDSILVGVLTTLVALPVYLRLFRAALQYVQQANSATQQGRPPAPFNPTDLISSGDQALVAIVGVLIGFVYYALFWRLRGATLGQQIAGLRVVPTDQGRFRGRLAWGQVVPRALIWTLPGLSGVLLVFQVVDVMLPLWHPKRQSVHDVVARTQVVAAAGQDR